ncbi:MAG: DUF4837 family protein [Flavobacterium sp.]
MKQLFWILTLFILISCKENKEKSLKESNGKLNTISIFIDNQYWKGEIGDSLRSILSSPVDGLTTIEPIFNFKNYDNSLLDDFMTASRNIIIIKKNDIEGFKIENNKYAKPQTVIIIQGKNVQNIIKIINDNCSNIVTAIKNGEIKENQRRINKSLFDDVIFNKKYQANINISSAYKVITNEKNLLWIRKELTNGYMNLMMYEVEPQRIEKNQEYLKNIIKVKDSAGVNIQTSLKETFMITEAAYEPYFTKVKINNVEAFETKGAWMMQNEQMGGPFINYVILNPKSKKYLVIEGFVYDPSSNNKRDMMLELEAMIKSIKF